MRSAANRYNPRRVSSQTPVTLTPRPTSDATLNFAKRRQDGRAANVHLLFSRKLLITASSTAAPDASTTGRSSHRASSHSAATLMRVPVIPTTPNFATRPTLAHGGLTIVASFVNWVSESSDYAGSAHAYVLMTRSVIWPP